MVIVMFFYDVMIVMNVEFGGGAARGSGSGPSFPGQQSYGGAGLEVQIIQLQCSTPCSRATLCKRALAQARANVVQAAVRYNWADQGLRVSTVSCTVI